MSTNIENRYDFVLIFDVQDGNPNGDPDAGNLPRIDPETGQGLVTDVCLKRKVRNFVALTKNSEPPYDIFVKEKAILNNLIAKAYKDLGIELVKEKEDTEDSETQEGAKSSKSGKKPAKIKSKASDVESVRQQMCKTYFDIRTFGAVMSTGANAGQVRGPVQFTFARSVDTIVSLEHSVTRCAVATEAEAEKQSGDNRTMGRKSTISYGVYVAHGFISPFLAAQTGFSTDDLNLLWDALINMFELDRSAARGLMSTCKLLVFKHASALGNAPSRVLFDTISLKAKPSDLPPRSFSDYELTLPRPEDLPPGVEMIEKL